MARLASRLAQLECRSTPSSIRPVLLLGSDDDAADALADWHSRHGPCDAEPFIYSSSGASVIPNVPIVSNVPAPPTFLEDERALLEADDWDDLELAEFLARPGWAECRDRRSL